MNGTPLHGRRAYSGRSAADTGFPLRAEEGLDVGEV